MIPFFHFCCGNHYHGWDGMRRCSTGTGMYLWHLENGCLQHPCLPLFITTMTDEKNGARHVSFSSGYRNERLELKDNRENDVDDDDENSQKENANTHDNHGRWWWAFRWRNFFFSRVGVRSPLIFLKKVKEGSKRYALGEIVEKRRGWRGCWWW